MVIGSATVWERNCFASGENDEVGVSSACVCACVNVQFSSLDIAAKGWPGVDIQDLV